MLTVIPQLDALNKEASELVSLIRYMRNRLTPINRLARDVIALIPEFLSSRERVVLTHVCRAWRQIFISCASLWTNFYYRDTEKTRTFLERSKSAPISLWLERERGLAPNDPFIGITPHAIGRLKELYVKTMPDHLEDITKHLVHPAPLLRAMAIDGGAALEHGLTPVLKNTLFDGDLSSVCELCLQSVRTELPWRNMNNLTQFTLAFMVQPTVSLGQLLDFFESSPCLVTITLLLAAPNFGVQDGRLISLSHLRLLNICRPPPPSLLLGHLVIPVGAEVVITLLNSLDPQVDEILPRSLNNLNNFSRFTKIYLHFDPLSLSMRLRGPNGRVRIATSPLAPHAAGLATRCLAQLDLSNIEYLDIANDGTMENELHPLLRSLINLRTLKVSLCETLPFMLGLNFLFTSDGVIVCPKLGEFFFRVFGQFHMGIMISIAAARVSKGVPLELVEVLSFGEPVQTERVAELEEHVRWVDISVEADRGDYFVDEDSDEEED